MTRYSLPPPQRLPSGLEADRHFYDDTSGFAGEGLVRHLGLIQTYFERSVPFLQDEFGKRGTIRALELGAGSCMLSLLVSKLPFVSQIDCLDISSARMKTVLPLANKLVAGTPEKLTLHEGDFGGPLPFPDQSYDLILFDASLHHSRSIWRTLMECRRTLRPGGLVVAQREQFLGLLTYSIKLRRLLRTEEVRAGVSENAYLRSQYDYYFRACGFEPRFLGVAENTLQRLLLPANGLVYSKWVIIAH